MKWSTEKVNKLKEYAIRNGLYVRPFLRDMKIESLLGVDDGVMSLPFESKGGVLLTPLLRKSKVQFEYTDIEYDLISNIKTNPLLFSDIFDLYEHQKSIISSYSTNRYTMVRSPRQVGITESFLLCAVYSVIKYDSNQGYNILFICDDLNNQFEKLIDILQNKLPFFLSPGFVSFKISKSGANIKFDNNCQIYFVNNLIKSWGDLVPIHFNSVIIDHANESHITQTMSLVANLSGDSRLIMSMGGHGKVLLEMWNRENNWNKIRVNWTDVPGRDLGWVKEEINKMGGLKDFISSYDIDDVEDIRNISIDYLL